MVKKYRGVDCANRSLAYTHCDISTIHAVRDEMLQAVYAFLGKYTGEYTTYGVLASSGDWAAALLLEFSRSATPIDNDNLINDLRILITALVAAYDKRVKIVDCGVIDMLDGRKLDDVERIERTKLLRANLVRIGGGTRYTVIEDQPTFNFKSSTVRDQALMFYADGEINSITASLKNKLSFNDQLTRERYSHLKKYKGNKIHSRDNMLYFMRISKCEHLLMGIHRDNYPDLADSFMEILAFERREE